MTIKKKIKISAVFATILLVTILLVSVVNAQGNETTQKNATEKPTFYPETLEELRSNPDFVAEYGSIPTFTTTEERSKWIAILSKILDNISVGFGQDQKMMKYFDPVGPIRASTVTSYDFIEISINNSSTVNKPFLDEFYQLIDSEANSTGISNVPVVFVREKNLTLADFKTSDSTNNTSNSTNESISNINNSSENK